jgi:hypothetical protein
MRARRLILALLLLAPVPLLGLGANAMADALARRAARSFDRIARVLMPARAVAPAEVFVEPDPESVPVESEPPPTSKRGNSRRVVPVHGIRVRADAVLRLANAGMRPSGIPVAARGNRPAGLALVGVSGLGIGLEDGDVLVSAGGRPALSVGDVVGVVIGSRGAHAPEICGRFWRKGAPWNLIVEQPYVKRHTPTSADTGAVRVARSGF